MIKKLWREYEVEDLFREIWSECPASVGLVSGYFHISAHQGHVAMIKDAATYCDQLIVVVNGTEATIQKYGFSLPIEDRLAVLAEFECVRAVIDWDYTNMSYMLEVLRPTIFLQGGNITEQTANEGELIVCYKHGIRVEYGVGGYDKKANNSEYIKMIRNT